MKRLLVILFVLSTACSLQAGLFNRHKHKRTFLFIEWRDKDSSIVLGHFARNKRKKIIEAVLPFRQVKPGDIEAWLGNEQGSAFLFFHCMWGQQANFHKHCLKSLSKITKGDTVDVTTISFLWHAGGILYNRDWDAAAGKGELIGPITGWINAHFKGNTNVLCHSMGNRFFEGTIRTMPSEQRTFKSIVLFSADLDNTVVDPDMQLCAAATQRLLVYVHHRDKMLLLSEIAHGRKRLGRSGFNSDFNKATVIDMTDHVWDFQNHTHFYRKWVQHSIREHLQ